MERKCEFNGKNLRACSGNGWNCARCEYYIAVKGSVSQEDEARILANCHKASDMLMEIGTMNNIPNELITLITNSSTAIIKIVEYINSLHKDNE